ncbi:MAG: hypothetical protein ACRDL5_05775 [Solirubrobacteraceae bacterium]
MRRALSRPTAIATAVPIAALGIALALSLLAPATSRAAAPVVDVFPIPGGRVAAPATQLTFRGLPISQLGQITVTGSVSGVHHGRFEAD